MRQDVSGWPCRALTCMQAALGHWCCRRRCHRRHLALRSCFAVVSTGGFVVGGAYLMAKRFASGVSAGSWVGGGQSCWKPCGAVDSSAWRAANKRRRPRPNLAAPLPPPAGHGASQRRVDGDGAASAAAPEEQQQQAAWHPAAAQGRIGGCGRVACCKPIQLRVFSSREMYTMY